MNTIINKKLSYFIKGFAILSVFLLLTVFSTGCQRKTEITSDQEKAGIVSTNVPEKNDLASKPEKSKDPEIPEKIGKPEKGKTQEKSSETSGEHPARSLEPHSDVKSAAPEGMLAPENLGMPLKTGFELQRAKGQFTQCQSNARNIATALEMYYTDHGKFPDSLSRLSPEYMRSVPKCAAANMDTYSDSYVTNDDRTANFFFCKGEYHKDMGVPANFPRNDSREGLLLPRGYEETLSPEMKAFRCESNLRNIFIAIELYSADHRGNCPGKLEQLTPDYLFKMPECPAAGKDTYTSSYSLKKDSTGEYYILFCSGNNHANAGYGKNFPCYEYKLGDIKKKPGYTNEEKKRMKQREAMMLLGDALKAFTGKEGKKARKILEQVKKMDVLDDKHSRQLMEMIDNGLKSKGE